MSDIKISKIIFPFCRLCLKLNDCPLAYRYFQFKKFSFIFVVLFYLNLLLIFFKRRKRSRKRGGKRRRERRRREEVRKLVMTRKVTHKHCEQ